MSKEKQLYKELYSIDSKYGHHDWSAPKRRTEVLEHIKLKPESVLDVGCGSNHLCSVLKEKGIKKCVGVDFASPQADVMADATDMPFSDQSYDLIICSDVLEHITEDNIDNCLTEFCRVGKRIYAKIALFPDVRKDGIDLHPCVKPPPWWIEKFKKFYKNIEFNCKPGSLGLIYKGIRCSHIKLVGEKI